MYSSEYWICILVIAIIYAIASGCICVNHTNSKGYRDIVGAFFLGSLFGIFGILYYVGIPDRKMEERLDRLIKLLERNGDCPSNLTQEEKEILGDLAPTQLENVTKLCVWCKRDIPVTSLKCPYCKLISEG